MQEISHLCKVCGAPKELKIATYDKRYNSFTGRDEDMMIAERYELSYYYPQSNEMILGLSCTECGIQYNMKSIGRY